MKRCPNCQRTYPDDSPGFCVNDGTQLVNEEAPAFDPQKTILASAPPPPQAPPQYSNPAPPLANQPPPPPPQPAWPPPPPHQQQQQAQNWGGGYYQQPGQPYGAPYAPPVGKGNKLSLAALVIGCISGFLGFLLFAGYQGWMRIFTRDTAYIAIITAVITGAAALVLGAIALISARQRSKALAVIGMVLSAASIAFYIYLETEYGILF